MPRATAEEAAATAHAVLDAAARLFAQEGFAGVSLNAVAAAAGVTRGAVYHHYAGKNGLFEAVAARLQGEVAAAVVAAAEDAGDDPAAQLRAGCHAFLEAITGTTAARVLLVEAPAAMGWARWRALDEEASVVHLREALRSAGVDDDLLDALTAQLSGAMNEAALWLAERDGDAEARRAAGAALDRLLTAVIG